MQNKQLQWAGVLTLISLHACTVVGPDYHKPKTLLPDKWNQSAPEQAGQTAQLANWWRGFPDAQLQKLIAQALQQNLDLQATTARIRAARAQVHSANANFWPELSATTLYQKQRISPNALQGMLGSVSGGGAQNGTGLGPLGTPFDLFRAGFDSSWELDIFGGLQRQQQAATAEAEALLESRRDVQVSLTAEVARNYFLLLSLRQQQALLLQQQENFQLLYRLGQAAYEEGLITILDQQQAELLLRNLQTKLPQLQQQIDITQHQLEYLCGLQVGALSKELAQAKNIPAVPQIPMGLPADLLRRRPDIRQAERKLAAATELLGAAIAEQFPKLSLTGNVGLQSQELSNFASMGSGFYGFGPRLSLPIFQLGHLAANVEAKRAEVQAAETLYQKTVLNSLREVADALSQLQAQQQRRSALVNAEQTAQHSALAARAFFSEGEADLKTALQSQLNWEDAQNQKIQGELDWLSANLAFYKALGGGWE